MIGPVINFASGYIQSLFTGAGKGSSSTNTASTTAAGGNHQDPNQVSPFAQILSSLQQLEQSNPSQYQQTTQQISMNLSTASQSATVSGNPAIAGELRELSTDFKNASTSGQLPNVQHLAQAIGSGAPHRYDGGGSAGSSSGSHLIDASMTGSSANSSLNATSIIDNALSSAGLQIG